MTMVIDMVEYTNLIRAAYHSAGGAAALSRSRSQAAGGAKRRIQDRRYTTEGNSVVTQLPHLYTRMIRRYRQTTCGHGPANGIEEHLTCAGNPTIHQDKRWIDKIDQTRQRDADALSGVRNGGSTGGITVTGSLDDVRNIGIR
jgi:hypothetical protein